MQINEPLGIATLVGIIGEAIFVGYKFGETQSRISKNKTDINNVADIVRTNDSIISRRIAYIENFLTESNGYRPPSLSLFVDDSNMR